MHSTPALAPESVEAPSARDIINSIAERYHMTVAVTPGKRRNDYLVLAILEDKLNWRLTFYEAIRKAFPDLELKVFNAPGNHFYGMIAALVDSAEHRRNVVQERRREEHDWTSFY